MKHLKLLKLSTYWSHATFTISEDCGLRIKIKISFPNMFVHTSRCTLCLSFPITKNYHSENTKYVVIGLNIGDISMIIR